MNFRTATVDAIDTVAGTVDVWISEAFSPGVPYGYGLNLVVGELVWVLQVGASAFVFGKPAIQP